MVKDFGLNGGKLTLGTNIGRYGGHAIIGSAFSHYTFHWSNGRLAAKLA